MATSNTLLIIIGDTVENLFTSYIEDINGETQYINKYFYHLDKTKTYYIASSPARGFEVTINISSRIKRYHFYVTSGLSSRQKLHLE